MNTQMSFPMKTSACNCANGFSDITPNDCATRCYDCGAKQQDHGFKRKPSTVGARRHGREFMAAWVSRFESS
jgi:hypothetical protein